MLLCHLLTFHPIRGTQNIVAVRVENRMEEPHVVWVVLNHENYLMRCANPYR